MRIISQTNRDVLWVTPPENIYLWNVQNTLNDFLLEIGQYNISNHIDHSWVKPTKVVNNTPYSTRDTSYGCASPYIKSLTSYTVTFIIVPISKMTVEVCEYITPRYLSEYDFWYKGWAVLNTLVKPY